MKKSIKNKVLISKEINNILIKIKRDYKNLSFEKKIIYLNLDSIDFLNLIFKLQTKFKIKITNKEFQNLETLNSLVKLIFNKV